MQIAVGRQRLQQGPGGVANLHIQNVIRGGGRRLTGGDVEPEGETGRCAARHGDLLIGRGLCVVDIPQAEIARAAMRKWAAAPTGMAGERPRTGAALKAAVDDQLLSRGGRVGRRGAGVGRGRVVVGGGRRGAGAGVTVAVAVGAGTPPAGSWPTSHAAQS